MNVRRLYFHTFLIDCNEPNILKFITILKLEIKKHVLVENIITVADCIGFP